jgi:Domain of unknown function (DUF4917)
MKIETFQDVLLSIGQNKGRPFHLMMGNGFSMAYDPKIFSYNALYDFVSALNDPTLTKIFGVVDTKNFELIMKELDTFSSFLDAFNADPDLRAAILEARQKLKTALIDAIKALHPEHVFAVPGAAADACASFLRTFLDTGGKIFTSNYDLLLYWVLMRKQIAGANDGFGRVLLNADDNPQTEDEDWSDLRWGPNRDGQCIYYLHGALPLFDTGVEVEKEVYDTQNYLLEKIGSRIDSGAYPIFVTAGDGREKLTQIMHNRYLTFCYEALSQIEGSLVTFGFNFGDYDQHIIEAVNEAAKHGRKQPHKLWSIYIGVYSDSDRQRIESLEHRFKCKLHVYDAKTAKVWTQ